jgi:hypothetical protein
LSATCAAQPVTQRAAAAADGGWMSEKDDDLLQNRNTVLE